MVRISGQNFTEAEIVADLYAGVLKKAGYDPQVKLVGTRDIYMKVFPKSIDVVPEYVGGILEFLNGTYNGSNAAPVTMSDAAQSISDAQPLLKKAGITLLDPSEATDSNAFFVTKKFADDNNVSTLSDLKGKSVVLAAAPDCKGRLDCEGGLTQKYGIKITKILPLGYASPQTYKSVLSGESQLGETSTTDATLESQGLVLLTDDKKIQPAENLVPAVSSSFLEAHPDVARAAQRPDGRADDGEPDPAQRGGVGQPGGPAGRGGQVPRRQRSELSRPRQSGPSVGPVGRAGQSGGSRAARPAAARGARCRRSTRSGARRTTSPRAGGPRFGLLQKQWSSRSVDRREQVLVAGLVGPLVEHDHGLDRPCVRRG